MIKIFLFVALASLFYLSDEVIIPFFVSEACKPAESLPNIALSARETINSYPCFEGTIYDLSLLLRALVWLSLWNAVILSIFIGIKKKLTWKNTAKIVAISSLGAFALFFFLVLNIRIIF